MVATKFPRWIYSTTILPPPPPPARHKKLGAARSWHLSLREVSNKHISSNTYGIFEPLMYRIISLAWILWIPSQETWKCECPFWKTAFLLGKGPVQFRVRRLPQLFRLRDLKVLRRNSIVPQQREIRGSDVWFILLKLGDLLLKFARIGGPTCPMQPADRGQVLGVCNQIFSMHAEPDHLLSWPFQLCCLFFLPHLWRLETVHVFIC